MPTPMPTALDDLWCPAATAQKAQKCNATDADAANSLIQFCKIFLNLHDG